MNQQEDQILLYRMVGQKLEKMLQAGTLKKGGRIPGERQLAELLKVSRGTLRNALEELEKRNFLLRVPGKGTYIRDNGMTVRNLKIGYLFPEPEISLVFQNYGNYAINSEVWRGIMQCCAAKSVTASFIPARPHDSDAGNQNIYERLKEECSAVILPSHEYSGLAKLLTARGFPFCFTAVVPEYPFVFYDVRKGAADAARQLLANGCRSVVMLNLQMKSTGAAHNTWEIKVDTFRREFAAAGFSIPDENIIELACSDENVLYELRELFPEGKNLPDSIFTATPMISFALLHIAAERHWRIPEDLKVIGYANNMAMRRTIPVLTHIELPHAAIGTAAVQILADHILSGKTIPEKTILEATLIQGETTI